VELVPFIIKGNVRENLPNHIIVNKSLNDYYKKYCERKFYPLIFSFQSIINGLLSHPIRSFSSLRDVVGFSHHGWIVSQWAKKHITDSHPILYTYWLERITYGLSLFKMKHNPNTILISRAHRYDLYENLRTHQFIPYREYCLNQLDKLFPISKNGSDYLNSKYPSFNKTEISYLGIINDLDNLSINEGHSILIVSCSRIVEVKRLDLIIEVLDQYCVAEKKKVRWVHFGDGPLMNEVKNRLKNLKGELEVELPGFKSNEYIHGFYNSEAVSCFINLSDSEGIPVSIMEAISYGIPVLARNVGGIQEIVSDENGKLMDADSSISDICNSMKNLIDNPPSSDQTIKTFKEKFEARTNYKRFYQDIFSLVK